MAWKCGSGRNCRFVCFNTTPRTRKQGIGFTVNEPIKRTCAIKQSKLHAQWIFKTERFTFKKGFYGILAENLSLIFDGGLPYAGKMAPIGVSKVSAMVITACRFISRKFFARDCGRESGRGGG